MTTNRAHVSRTPTTSSLSAEGFRDSSSMTSSPVKPARVGMIWAQSNNGVIGDGTAMPWLLPEDLKHFKETTLGAPVIMGRRTWDSLNPRFRPLPGRRNIVLSRSTTSFPGAQAASDLASALAAVADQPVAWIIGGGQVYRDALLFADECVVTEIDIDVTISVPVKAPELKGWEKTAVSNWHESASGLRYRFCTYRRHA